MQSWHFSAEACIQYRRKEDTMNRIRNWHIAGAVFTVITGTLLHFVTDWFDGGWWNVVGAVNESTWEHLKLIFWPMVVFGALEMICYGRKEPGFIPVRVASVLLGMGSIIVLFYTYTGIWGRHILVVDIAVFLVSVAAAYWFSFHKLKAPGERTFCSFAVTCGVAVFTVLCIAMILFTYDPPRIALFEDPVTGHYGLTR